MKSVYSATTKWFQQKEVPLWAADETTSTNDIAKLEAFRIEEPLKVYIAKAQTQGKGRWNRAWYNCQVGAQLLASWSFQLQKSPQPITTALIGLALYRSCNAIWPQVNFSLKAPNDLLIDGQKAAGILVESLSQGPRYRAIVGLGFNVTAHPTEVPGCTHLTSLFSKDLTEADWQEWLLHWQKNIAAALMKSGETQIDTEDRAELLKALNANPHLEEKLTDVSPQGDLIYASRTTPWEEI